MFLAVRGLTERNGNAITACNLAPVLPGLCSIHLLRRSPVASVTGVLKILCCRDTKKSYRQVQNIPRRLSENGTFFPISETSQSGPLLAANLILPTSLFCIDIKIGSQFHLIIFFCDFCAFLINRRRAQTYADKLSVDPTDNFQSGPSGRNKVLYIFAKRLPVSSGQIGRKKCLRVSAINYFYHQ